MKVHKPIIIIFFQILIGIYFHPALPILPQKINNQHKKPGQGGTSNTGRRSQKRKLKQTDTLKHFRRMDLGRQNFSVRGQTM